MAVDSAANLNPSANQDHHVGSPPTGFRNPWPSHRAPATGAGFFGMLSVRFSDKRNFVPVPGNERELVQVRKPDWGSPEDPNGEKLKATWIGHASWLIEISRGLSEETDEGPTQGTVAARGIRIMLDPVFSDRTSPVQFFGPKRYRPTPCTIAELPEIDICLISHSHYDHLDAESIKQLYLKNPNMHFFCALRNKQWYLNLECSIPSQSVTEMDWWQSVTVTVQGVGEVELTCTPAQHFSGRTPTDRDSTLWCSWVIEQTAEMTVNPRKLYFAGDTGYRTVDTAHPTKEEEASQPGCPAFKEIGDLLGPFDLALLPIGLCTPRDFMSNIHCAPEDSICVHKDVRSKKSIGMHYGTVRGGISAQYEDVRYPPRRWREVCEEAGLVWGQEAGLCDIGETVFV